MCYKLIFKLPELLHHVDWKITAHVWELLTFPRNVGIQHSRRLKPRRLGHSTNTNVHNVEIKFQQLFILLVTSLVFLQIFAAICEDVDIQQCAKPIKTLPCYNLSVRRRAVIMRNEHKNVTFWIKQKEYDTYCRNVMILYVAKTQ